MRLLNEQMARLAGELASGRFADMAGLSAEDIAAWIEDFLRKNRTPPSDHNESESGS